MRRISLVWRLTRNGTLTIQTCIDKHEQHFCLRLSQKLAVLRVFSRQLPNMQSGLCSLAQVLELMELTSLRNAIVGLPGVTGLSVEQRNRLTIGVELVSNPGTAGFIWII